MQNIDKQRFCCFTGHRKLPKEQLVEIKTRLKTIISGLINKGVDTFYSGGAVGFDILCSMAVIELKQVYPDIKLIIVIPCRDQEKYWSEKDKSIYEDVKNMADECVYLAERYSSGCMHVRNRYMVDRSDYCICYLTENKGGTFYTVNYARKKEIRIFNIAKLNELGRQFNN